MTFLAALILLSQTLAPGHSLPWSALPAQMGTVIWVIASMGLLGLGFALLKKRDCTLTLRLGGLFERRFFWASYCGLNALFLIYSYTHFRNFGYAFPYLQLGLVFLSTLLIRRKRWGVAFSLSLALQAGAIFSFPLHDLRSDMLPVIQEAFSQWSRGNSPYGSLQLAHLATDQMPYLPGTFFSHAPAWLLGIDLRWNQFAYRLLWMILLYRNRLRFSGPRSDLVQLFALNPYLNFRHDLYFEFFLLLIALYSLRPQRRWFLLPLLVMTRQWAWVLAPFLFIREVVFATSKERFRWLTKFAFSMLALLGLTAWLLIPSTSIEVFRDAIFTHQSLIQYEHFIGDYGLTFAPVFYQLNWVRWMQPIQGVAVLGLLTWASLKDPTRLLTYAGFALICFVLLNVHFWAYFWLTPAWWAILCCQGSDRKQGPLHPVPLPP